MSGRIITFYSYKGGVGRTMALSNTAWLLASNGKRVLAIDWDLEAPGLTNFFKPFLAEAAGSRRGGLLDLLEDLKSARARDLPAIGSHTDRNGDDLIPYIVSSQWLFPRNGTLDLMPAGGIGGSYGRRVNAFDWHEFYDRFGGRAALERFKEQLRSNYDYVLIDSRTGISDAAGICTVQMPDTLVICTTMGRQSIDGAATVAVSVDQHTNDNLSRAIRIFPIITRVEYSEQQQLADARTLVARHFEPFLWHLPVHQREHYFQMVEIPYVPFYAYAEILYAFAEDQRGTIAAAIERIAALITDGDAGQLPPIESAVRADVRRAYFSGAAQVPASCMISYSSNDAEFVSKLVSDLQRVGVECWYAPNDLAFGAKIRDGLGEAIRTHDKVLLVLSQSSVRSRWVETEVEEALEREAAVGGVILLPIRIDEAVMATAASWAADVRRQRNIGDFTEWHDDVAYRKAFHRLLDGLRRQEHHA